MSYIPNTININDTIEPSQITTVHDSFSSSCPSLEESSPPEEFTLYQPSQHEQSVKIKGAKIVVPTTLLHFDSKKQNESGLIIMRRVLETVDRLGYDQCLGFKKKGPFLKSLNSILHQQDGPLFKFKKSQDNGFQKKVSAGLKLLDDILVMPHSNRNGDDGEEWPDHLSDLLTLYSKVKESETTAAATASAQNLVVQRLIFDQQPSEHNLVNKERSSVRNENAKEGHTLVVRGDNSHDASGLAITSKTPSPPAIENRKKPKVTDLMSASNKSKEGFDIFFASYQDVAQKREHRIEAQSKRKLELSEKKHELKEKRQKIEFLIQTIAFTKDEIITFQDEPEMKELAIERYKELNSELKCLANF